MKYVIKIEGMGCANCVKHVTEALTAIDGTKAEVSLKDGAAVVETSAVPEALRAAVEDAGYDVLSVDPVA